MIDDDFVEARAEKQETAKPRTKESSKSQLRNAALSESSRVQDLSWKMQFGFYDMIRPRSTSRDLPKADEACS